MKKQAAFLFAFVLLANVHAFDRTVVATTRLNDVVWLFFGSPTFAERYDLKQQKWLTPVRWLLANGERILAASASADGIVLAVGTDEGAGARILLTSFRGRTVSPLNSTRWKPASLFVDGDLLIAVGPGVSNSQFDQINVFDRKSGQRLSEFSSYGPLSAVTVMLPENRIVGFDHKIQGLGAMDYSDDGARTNLTKGGFNGASSGPSALWASSDGWFVDSAGRVLGADLDVRATLNGAVNAFAENPDGAFVIARKWQGYELIGYSADFVETGRVQMDALPGSLWICDGAVIGFSKDPMAVNGLRADVVPLSALQGEPTPTPTATLVPTPRDAKPPRVRLREGHRVITSRRVVTLHAEASDNVAVATVEFATGAGGAFQEATFVSPHWEFRLPLKSRLTSVRVRARDTAGNVSAPFKAVIFRTGR